MSSQFNLWACPYLSVKDKKSLDNIGLPFEKREAVLIDFLSQMITNPEAKIHDHSELFKIWFNEGINPFKEDSGNIFSQCLKTQNPSLIITCLESTHCPSIQELNTIPVTLGFHRSNKPFKTNLVCYASAINNLKLLSYLVEKGLNLNEKDDFGMTPLHNAKSIDAVNILIKGDVNTEIKDMHGRLPDVACHCYKQKELEQMRRKIITLRSQNAKDSPKKGSQQAVIKKLFTSVWKNDEPSFHAYFDSLTEKVETLRQPNHGVSLLVWAIRRQISGCDSHKILEKLLNHWPLEALEEESYPGVKDKMWIWALSCSQKSKWSPCHVFCVKNKILQDPIELTQEYIQVLPVLSSFPASLEKAWNAARIHSLAEINKKFSFKEKCEIFKKIIKPNSVESIEMDYMKNKMFYTTSALSTTKLVDALPLIGLVCEKTQSAYLLNYFNTPVFDNISKLNKKECSDIALQEGFAGLLDFEPLCATKIQQMALEYQLDNPLEKAYFQSKKIRL